MPSIRISMLTDVIGHGLQELVPAAVDGTRNVITAAAGEGVRRVVFTSSYGAVRMDPNRSPDAVVDETCWSDYDFCKRTDVSQPSLLRTPFDHRQTHMLTSNGIN